MMHFIRKAFFLAAVLLATSISALLIMSAAQAAPPLSPLAAPGVCTVTTTADSGPGSLRQCLLDLQSGDTITFDPNVFPLTSPVTIAPTSSRLPTITANNVTIDGSNAGVILDGSSLSSGTGLDVNGASGVTIKGMQIVNFPGAGIALQNGATNNTIGGLNGSPGVACTGDCNLISGNAGHGIELNGTGVRSNLITGNYIGVNATGTSALGNSGDGVLISLGAQNNTVGGSSPGERNLISGNNGGGVGIRDSGTISNTVSGNFIGTDATGTAAIGNKLSGIGILQGASNNTIGGNNATPVGGCTGECNVISGNGPSAGIAILNSGTDHNVVSGNYIGLDVTGVAALPNTRGIWIAYGAQYNIIGGTTPQERNIVSGNTEPSWAVGIWIEGTNSNHNKVIGNFIGTDATGTTSVGNGICFGISISGGASYNIVGGSTPAERNIISGNQGSGVFTNGALSNTITGNYIGTDFTGTKSVPNSNDGVQLGTASVGNQIGGNNASPGGKCTGECNLISGNLGVGVSFNTSGTMNNIVSGNYIGTDLNGTAVISNGNSGVYIFGGANHNTIGGDTPQERNIISGNDFPGVMIGDGPSNYNVVKGNYIGPDVSGTVALGNAGNGGVSLWGDASHNIIGPGNIIAFHERAGYQSGVQVSDANTLNNTITQNSIYRNAWGGIILNAGGNNNLAAPVITAFDLAAGTASGAACANCTVEIFSDDEDEGQVYEGSTTANGSSNWSFSKGAAFTGPHLTATATDSSGNTSQFSAPVSLAADCTVTTTADSGLGSLRQCLLDLQSGDTISFDPTVFPLASPATIAPTSGRLPTINANNVTIDGSNAGVILDGSSLSSGTGLDVNGASGVTIKGLQIVNFPGDGIHITNGATNNTIGGSNSTPGGACTGDCNLISGNNGSAVSINGINTMSNTVSGNYIGTDSSGIFAIGNSGLNAVHIWNGASHNNVGGTTDGERNVVSGNNFGVIINGANNNHIIGNYLGVDATGSSPLGNQAYGAGVGDGGQYNVIEDNVAGSNGGAGIYLHRPGTKNNRVIGNIIGTDKNGSVALGNGTGVEVALGAQENFIGGTTPAERNLISGNSGPGVSISDSGTMSNTVSGNYIGTDVVGVSTLGNGAEGIRIFGDASHNIIGNGNTIAFNGGNGIVINESTTVGNTITQNSIHHNALKGIILLNGSNNNLAAPAITAFDLATGTTGGTGCANCTVEIFSDDEDEGQVYEGSTTSDGSGNWSFSKGAAFTGPHLTATATDSSGNTSQFSAPVSPAADCTVTTTADSGAGSLRQCLLDAGVGSTITFNTTVFPPASPATIALTNGPLPDITANNLAIDGSSAGVILDGSSLSSGHGLVIDGASRVTIKGLQILNFPNAGIRLGNGAASNTIGGLNGTPDGACSGDCNLISGNGRNGSSHGIEMDGSGVTSNTITGNYIGTDINGTSPISNFNSGIIMVNGPQGNIIGGSIAGERNLISGNGSLGIHIMGGHNNTFIGNYIGTNAAGTGALGNFYSGILINSGAQGNTVGGTNATPGGACTGECNLISGNNGGGVDIDGSGSVNNTVSSNYIGTNMSGTAALTNSGSGVGISNAAQTNVITGNLISGNGAAGVRINDSGTISNTISGNYIGTDAAGAAVLGNDGVGILIGDGASNNTIGGSNATPGGNCTGDCNLISGNRIGIQIDDNNTLSNTITGNYIGTDVAGALDLGNEAHGVGIDGAGYNFIGGSLPGQANLISGNEEDGIEIESVSSDIVIKNNLIGVKANGTGSLPNVEAGVDIREGSTNITVTNNLISENGEDGVIIEGQGILSDSPLLDDAYLSFNGGPNQLSNGSFSGNLLHWSTGDENPLANRSLNTTDFHSAPASYQFNRNDGAGDMETYYDTLAQSIVITDSDDYGSSTWLNTTPGTNVTLTFWYKGSLAWAELVGHDGADSDDFAGIDLSYASDWTQAILTGTVPAGVDRIGVYFAVRSGPQTSHNIVQGNRIGVDASGVNALPNKRYGVHIRNAAVNNLVGGSNSGDSNIISSNGGDGVRVADSGTLYNTIQQNSIYNNVGLGIELLNGGNLELFPPILTHVSPNLVKGTAPPNSRVEIYSGDDGEGRYYHGSETADNSGAFTFVPASALTGPQVLATATDSDGNTSEFSEPYTPTVDIQITAIIRPKPIETAGQVITPVVAIKNTGTTIESGISLAVQASGSALNAAYTPPAQQINNLPPGAQISKKFPPFAANQAGSYEFVATTSLAGDQQPGNDQKRRTVTVNDAIVDLWTRDSSGDDGTIPSPDKRFWLSPDIWVRNSDDGGVTHQEPVAGRENWVYLRLYNRGNSASDGADTVKMYWHDPSLAIQCDKWALIGSQTIPSTPAHTGVQLLKIPWTPSRSGHNCLYAEIISDDDPIVTQCLVRWENNLGQRNVNILPHNSEPAAQAAGDITFEVTNVKSIPKPIDLVIDVVETLDNGAVRLDLGTDLAGRWAAVDGPTKSSGISWSGGNIVTMIDPSSATIAGIPMRAGETQTVQMLVNAPSVETATVTISEIIDAGTGVPADDTVMGGNTYVFTNQSSDIYLPLIVKNN